MTGHWQILGGHPGGMGPKKKRKGQYSPFVDYKEPQRWRKKMDLGKGMKSIKETIEESIEMIFNEVSKNIDNEVSKNIDIRLQDFVLFAKEFLGLKKVPSIKLVDERESDMTTACYDTKKQTIKVLRGNRAFFDICRSVAHELVHRAQHEKMDGSSIDGNAGSKHENEANAIAGEIVRLYGSKNSSFYEE